MLDYNNYTLLLEMASNLERIKRIANIPEIIDWCTSIDKKLSYWICKQLLSDLFSTKDNFIQNNIQEIKRWIKSNHFPDKRTREQLLSYLDRSKLNILNKIREILQWVNSPLHKQKPAIRHLKLSDALNLARKWQDDIDKRKKSGEIFESGNIIMKFDDDWYWIDLLSKNDDEEGKLMGHCGHTTEGSTLLSLRDPEKISHITISYDEDLNIFCQIKGYNNSKPKEQYHKYIVDLIIKLHISGFKSEYNLEDDFHVDDLDNDLYNILKKENPEYIKNEDLTPEFDYDELRDKAFFGYTSIPFITFINDYCGTSHLENYIDDVKFIDEFVSKHYYENNFDNVELDIDEAVEYIISKIDKEKLIKYLFDNGFTKEEDKDENGEFDIETELSMLKEKDLKKLIKELDNVHDFCKVYVNETLSSYTALEILKKLYAYDTTELNNDLYDIIEKYIDKDECIQDYINQMDEEELEKYA